MIRDQTRTGGRGRAGPAPGPGARRRRGGGTGPEGALWVYVLQQHWGKMHRGPEQMHRWNVRRVHLRGDGRGEVLRGRGVLLRAEDPGRSGWGGGRGELLPGHGVLSCAYGRRLRGPGRPGLSHTQHPHPGVPPMSEVTRILSAIEQGDPQAAEQLLPLVYDELRQAGGPEAGPGEAGPDAPGHRPGPRGLPAPGRTASRPQRWDGRGHFFAAAAEAMRRILVENARRKARLKHGGERERRIDLDGLPFAPPGDPLETLACTRSR